MTITKLQRTVVDALEDIKAQDIQVFNTTGLSDLFDRVVLASATSNRQTRSLANHVKEKAKEKGFPVVSTEGEESGEWVLVDLGDMVVHIMQPAIRAYYNLEELWGAKPVKVKLGGGQGSHGQDSFPYGQPRGEPDAAPRATVARKAGTRQSAVEPADAQVAGAVRKAPRKAASKTLAAGAPDGKTATKKGRAAGGPAKKPAVSGATRKPASPGGGKTAVAGGASPRPTLTGLRRARTGQP